VQLVESAWELMLAHQEFGDKSYGMYQVDLDNVTLCRVKSFGGGRHACSLVSVPVGVISMAPLYILVIILKAWKT
jgi:hypothetical protein